MLAALRKKKGQVHDFPGGIHPPENKAQSAAAPIRPGPLPDELILPLNMHAGAPARPVVALDEPVLKGQLIARAEGRISAPVHAPTSGRVTAIENRPVQHPSGMTAPCIVLEPDGREDWIGLDPWPDWAERDPAELQAHLASSGLAGLGGAGFPTAVKADPGDATRVEQLIINAAECEPYITADDRLMRERAAGIAQGIRMLAHVLRPDEILVGIEDNKPEALEALRAALDPDMAIRVVATRYPSGGDKQLIQLLTGKEVPTGDLPARVGVVCQNVSTVYGIYRYLEHGEPLIRRVTTLTGEALAYPGNYEVLLGTPVRTLVAHAGIDADDLGKLIAGGSMMGVTLPEPAAPVVKTSNCLIAAAAGELPEPPAEQPCIRCGACAEVCPANLLPQQLYWYARNDEFERAQQYNLMDCIECGACAYVCPSHIPLVQYYQYAKGEIRNQEADQARADHARQRFEARQQRLERRKAEKEARRRERRQTRHPGASRPATSGTDPNLKALRNEMQQAEEAHKAARREAKTAEAEDRADAAELRARADEHKQQADALKQKVRAQREAGSSSASGSAGPSADTGGSGAGGGGSDGDGESEADARARRMKQLKAAYNKANKQWKQAKAAFDKARRDGAENLDELSANVDKLRQRADDTRAQMDALVQEAKQGVEAATGRDLKTLKKEATDAELAARRKAKELDAAREAGDAQQVAALAQEHDQLRRTADDKADYLQRAMAEQGMKEDE
jgi:electron transport complex protein RnfC